MPRKPDCRVKGRCARPSGPLSPTDNGGAAHGYRVVRPRCSVFLPVFPLRSDPDKMRLRLGFSVSLAVCVMLALCVVLLAVNVFELNWIQYEHNTYHHGREPYVTDMPPSSPSTSPRHGQAKRPASYIVLAKHVRYHHLRHRRTTFPLVDRRVDVGLSTRSDLVFVLFLGRRRTPGSCV